MDSNALIKVFGFLPAVLHGDPAVFDRWLWLRRNLKPGSLRTLDAGCGSGAFALYAAKRGNETTGISFDERNNQIAEERAKILKLNNVRFMTGDLKNLDHISRELGLFDQVICLETIEHILDDKKLIRDFSNILKSGGRLLITAPYLHYDKHLLGDDRVVLSVYDGKGSLIAGERGGHVRWGYTHEDIGKKLKEAGFEVVKKDYITGILSQYVIVGLRALSKRIPGKLAWALTFPLRILPIFDRPITALVRHPYLSVGVVAKKI